MAPRDRGDISAKLEIFATRIHDIDLHFNRLDRSRPKLSRLVACWLKVKTQVGVLLDTASSEEFKGLFDEEFRNSAGDLINLFSELVDQT